MKSVLETKKEYCNNWELTKGNISIPKPEGIGDRENTKTKVSWVERAS